MSEGMIEFEIVEKTHTRYSVSQADLAEAGLPPDPASLADISVDDVFGWLDANEVGATSCEVHERWLVVDCAGPSG